MKLIVNKRQEITNSQADKRAVVFCISFKLELSPQEEELIQKYSLDNRRIGHGERFPWKVLRNFREGVEFCSTDVNELVTYETNVKADLQKLILYLKNAYTFQGRQETLF